jgi:hypothetical protein
VPNQKGGYKIVKLIDEVQVCALEPKWVLCIAC